MTGWHDGPMLAFDTESSDRDPAESFLVQAALARIIPGEGAVTRLWLLQPPADGQISDGATAVHGISTDLARSTGQQRTSSLVLIRDTIVDWLRKGLPVVAFNAPFDTTLLEYELRREQLPTVTDLAGDWLPMIDPHVLDKHISYRRGKRTLETCCEHYQVKIDGAHDAGHDALAAARVAWRIGQTNQRIAALSLTELHAEQILWRQQQMDSLRLYFEQHGIDHDGCDPSWPVRRTAAAAGAA